MNGLLLAVFLWAQAGVQNPGVVTGLVRGAGGASAAGIRVYAITVRDAVEQAASPTALESQAQTDASGRYRLEVAPGRYYIASGSLGMPTYFPGVTDVKAARPVSVAAGGVVDSIDFSSFVPASRQPVGFSFPILPGSTGVLSGVLRYADGAVANGATVVLTSTSIASTGTTVMAALTMSRFVSTAPGGFSTMTILRTGPAGTPVITQTTQTDATGRYRFENVPPDTYYIAAGFADAPVFYPGGRDPEKITTTPATRNDALDFTVPAPQPLTYVTGAVMASIGHVPAVGATVRLIPRKASGVVTPSVDLPIRFAAIPSAVAFDGSFRVNGVPSGEYTVEVTYPGMNTVVRDITVGNQPTEGIDLEIPRAGFAGKIREEDGTPLVDPQAFGEAITTTTTNPNILLSTILPISPAGAFARLLEADQYRFYLRTLPSEFRIVSITAGGVDLLKEPLKVSAVVPLEVDIRVAPRTTPPPTGVSVSGTVLDSMTGLPAAAERVTLCCLESGPAERLSAPIDAQGNFELVGVPPGRFTIGLKAPEGKRDLYTVNPKVEVTDQPVTGLSLASTPQFGPLSAVFAFEDGRPLPEDFPAGVLFTGSGGRVQTVAEKGSGGVYNALLPVGDRYIVSATNLPSIFAVMGIHGPTEVQPANNPPIGAPAPGPAPVVITIGPKP